MAAPVTVQAQNFTAAVNTTTDGQLDPTQNPYYALGFGKNSRPITVEGCVIDGATATWGLKFSRCFDVNVKDCAITGGTERALDMVRGGKATFTNCKFMNGGQRPVIKSRFDLRSSGDDIGLKGGIYEVTFDSCTMNDLWLGDYSIYDQGRTVDVNGKPVSRPYTRRIKLVNCTNPNGGPIIVRGIHSWKVETVNTPISQFKWPGFVVWTYWLYNRLFGDKRVITPDQFVLTPEELV